MDTRTNANDVAPGDGNHNAGEHAGGHNFHAEVYAQGGDWRPYVKGGIATALVLLTVAGIIYTVRTLSSVERLEQEIGKKAERNDVANLQQKVDAKAEKSDLTNLQEKVEGKADSLVSQNALNDDKTEITALRGQMTQLTGTVNVANGRLETLANKHEIEVATLRGKADASAEKVAKLETSSGERCQEVKRLRDTLEKLTAELATIKEKLAAMESPRRETGR